MQNWDPEISRKRFFSLSLCLFAQHLMLSASAGFSDSRSLPAAATVFLCTLSPSTLFPLCSMKQLSFLFLLVSWALVSWFNQQFLRLHSHTRTPLKERWGKSSRNRFGVSSPAPQMLIFDHQPGLGKLCLSVSYVVYNLRANQVQRLNFTHCSPDHSSSYPGNHNLWSQTDTQHVLVSFGMRTERGMWRSELPFLPLFLFRSFHSHNTNRAQLSLTSSCSCMCSTAFPYAVSVHSSPRNLIMTRIERG